MVGNPGSRPALAFIFVTALLDVMSMGIIIPVLPLLIERFAGGGSAGGWWNGVMVALWGGMQFLCSPAIGSLSDRYGRRPVILISTAGLALDWALMALAPNLWWLAIGRIIGGMTSSSFTAVYAYMADITAPEQRARAYGLIGAAFAGGFVAGPALGGIVGQFGPRMPFWAAAALSGVAFLYGLLVLPESLPKDRRMAFSWKRANPLGAMRLLMSRPGLLPLAGVNFFTYFAHHVYSVVYVLYAGHRHGLGPLQVGMLLALAGILEMAVQAVLVGPVTRRLGDRGTMAAGLAMGSLGMLAMGLAPTPWLFAAALLPNALWALAMPTIQALMTRQVSEREQGQLQGANNSLVSAAGIVSPLFFGAVYGASMLHWPSLSFVIAAGFLLTAAAMGVMAGRHAET